MRKYFRKTAGRDYEQVRQSLIDKMYYDELMRLQSNHCMRGFSLEIEQVTLIEFIFFITMLYYTFALGYVGKLSSSVCMFADKFPRFSLTKANGNILIYEPPRGEEPQL